MGGDVVTRSAGERGVIELKIERITEPIDRKKYVRHFIL